MIGLATLLPGKAEAETTWSADTSVHSKYLASTGSVFEDRIVRQSSLNVSRGNFWGTLWANVNSDELSEVDYMAGYGKSLGPFNLSANAGFFNLRSFDTNVIDVWASASMQVPLNPKLTVERNLSAGGYDNDHGTYVDLEVNHNLVVGPVTIPVNAHVQYNNHYFADYSGASVAQIDASLPMSLGKLALTPKLKAQKTLNGKNFNNEMVTSVTANYSF